jgi:hypothetical protein
MATKYAIALVAVAALCLIAAPAFSMPSDKGAPGFRHEGNCPMMNNLTVEEMGNMTLGELKEMQRSSFNNSVPCPTAGENCSRGFMKEDGSMMPMNGMHIGDRMQMGERDGRMDGFGPNDGFSGRQDNDGRRYGRQADGMIGHAPLLLLADDLTVEILNNMTLNEIRQLQEKKMQEMDNMTLNEIKELKDQKMQERNNMTLNELRVEHENMRQISRILQGGRSFSCAGMA